MEGRHSLGGQRRPPACSCGTRGETSSAWSCFTPICRVAEPSFILSVFGTVRTEMNPPSTWQAWQTLRRALKMPLDDSLRSTTPSGLPACRGFNRLLTTLRQMAAPLPEWMWNPLWGLPQTVRPRSARSRGGARGARLCVRTGATSCPWFLAATRATASTTARCLPQWPRFLPLWGRRRSTSRRSATGSLLFTSGPLRCARRCFQQPQERTTSCMQRLPPSRAKRSRRSCRTFRRRC
mmetsp:Transcript_11140/g.29636  ORF Transcript_11140/g.29636 Transcript_11140/m.29636 type:complete len:237 (+) Transcript_11140:1088-1798(+)